MMITELQRLLQFRWMFFILYIFDCNLSQPVSAGLPTSPPKLVRPTQLSSISFEQVLSNKLHSSLVIPSTVSKKNTIMSGSAKSSVSTISLTLIHSDTTLQYGAILQGIEAKSLSLPSSTCIESTIQLVGTKEKKRILEKYQEQYRSDNPNSIVTKKKGKNSDDIPCKKRSRMRPSLDKWYRVEELYLYNVIPIVIKQCGPSLSDQDFYNLRLVDKDFSQIIPKVSRW